MTMARWSNTKPVERQARAYGWSEATYVAVINQLGDRFVDRATVRARSLGDLLALRDARIRFLLTGIPALALFTDYPFDVRTSQDPGLCLKHLAHNARLNLTALDKGIRLAGGPALTIPSELSRPGVSGAATVAKEPSQ